MSKPVNKPTQKTNIPCGEEKPYKLSDIPGLIEEASEFNAQQHAFYDELFNKECRCAIRTINANIK